jgi:hypothetical protein
LWHTDVEPPPPPHPTLLTPNPYFLPPTPTPTPTTPHHTRRTAHPTPQPPTPTGILHSLVPLPLLVDCHCLQIPETLQGMYRWFNVPASADPKSPDNPLNHIRAHAKVEDYVLLKLDIDNNAVEELIVNSILADPEVGWCSRATATPLPLSPLARRLPPPRNPSPQAPSLVVSGCRLTMPCAPARISYCTCHRARQALPLPHYLSSENYCDLCMPPALCSSPLPSPQIMALVDEFYWEHHVNMEPLASCCWATTKLPKKQEASLAYFSKLRAAGLRAHSWT